MGKHSNKNKQRAVKTKGWCADICGLCRWACVLLYVTLQVCVLLNNVNTEYLTAQPGNNKSLSPQNVESFEEIGLVQSPSPRYSSAEPQQLQNSSTLSSFQVSPTIKHVENLFSVFNVKY